jgi:hypothetical protein
LPSFSSNVTAGDKIFVFWGVNYSASSVTACGVAATQVFTAAGPQMWMANVTTSGSCTVTINGSGLWGDARAAEVGKLAGAVDGTVTYNTGSGSSPTAGALTLSVVNDAILVMVTGATPSGTTCTGLTNKLQLTIPAILFGTAAPGSFTPSCALSYSDSWQVDAVSIKQ